MLLLSLWIKGFIFKTYFFIWIRYSRMNQTAGRRNSDAPPLHRYVLKIQWPQIFFIIPREHRKSKPSFWRSCERTHFANLRNYKICEVKNRDFQAQKLRGALYWGIVMPGKGRGVVAEWNQFVVKSDLCSRFIVFVLGKYNFGLWEALMFDK